MCWTKTSYTLLVRVPLIRGLRDDDRGLLATSILVPFLTHEVIIQPILKEEFLKIDRSQPFNLVNGTKIKGNFSSLQCQFEAALL